MVAIVPILPIMLSPILSVLGGLIVTLATVLGLSRDQARRRMILRFLWGQRYSLLVLGGAGSLLGYSWTKAWEWVHQPILAPVAIETGADWPLFRGGPQRTGAVTPRDDLRLRSVRWMGGVSDSFFASPTVSGNRVFNIGSSTDRGRIYCWEYHSGALQWVMEPPGMRATFSSPVIVGQRLICGEGTHRTTGARVFCFDISQPESARLIWSLTTKSHVECTPVVVGDRVYVGAGDDGVYALGLEGDSAGQPIVHWHIPGDRLPDVETALVADAHRVIVGCGAGPPAVVSLDSRTGQELNRWTFDLPVHAPPALVGDRVYVGMGRGNYVETPDDDRGAIAAIDLSSGKVMWTLPTPATVLGAIVADRDEIFSGCADGVVRVVSTSGSVLRSWQAGNSVNASLAVTPSRIIGITLRGRLFCLDRRTMELLDERQMGVDGLCISSPAIVGDSVLVGTERAGMSCLGPPR